MKAFVDTYVERSENPPMCLTKSVFLNKLQRSLKVKDDTCLRTQLILILLFRLFLSSLALLLMPLCFPRLETPWGLGNWENMYFSIGSQSVRLPGLQSCSTLKKKKVYYYPLEANMVKACYNKARRWLSLISPEAILWKNSLLGLRWGPGCYDSVLPMKGAQVWFLVRGLGPICYNWDPTQPNKWINIKNNFLSEEKIYNALFTQGRSFCCCCCCFFFLM